MEFSHEMQHPDSPTWCVHCGMFDIYCEDGECTSDRRRQYDSAINGGRMLKELFGLEDQVQP